MTTPHHPYRGGDGYDDYDRSGTDSVSGDEVDGEGVYGGGVYGEAYGEPDDQERRGRHSRPEEDPYERREPTTYGRREAPSYGRQELVPHRRSTPKVYGRAVPGARAASDGQATLPRRAEAERHVIPRPRAAPQGNGRADRPPAGTVYGRPVSEPGRAVSTPEPSRGAALGPAAYGVAPGPASASAPAPAPASKSSRTRASHKGRPQSNRGVKVIVGVLAVVGICIGAAIFALGKDTWSASQNAAPAQRNAAQEEAIKHLPGLGATVRDGKFEFVARAVTCGKKKVGTGALQKTAHGQFCLVTVTVKNLGTVARIFDTSPEKAFNADGQEYGADSAAGIYVNQNGQPFLGQITPGATVSGKLVFDVPKDQRIKKLEFHESAFSAGVAVRVD